MAVNYATWNPNDKGANCTLSGGDLVATSTGGAGFPGVRSTVGVTSGKWYWEISCTSSGTPEAMAGVADSQEALSIPGAGSHGWGYWGFNGQKYHSGSGSAFGASYTTQVIGFALDADAGTLEVFKSNVSQGVITLTGVSAPYFAMVGNTSGASNLVCTANFGASAFTYTPPAGYNAGLYGVVQDAYTNWNTVAGGTATNSFSHAGTSAADYALVMISNQSGVDDLTSITYGGQAMTLLAKKDRVSAGWYGYVYGLASPPTGTQTVSVTRTNTSNSMAVNAVTLKGAHNVTAANATGTAGTASTSSLTCSLTPTLGNCAVYGHFIMDNTGIAASTNLTSLGTAISNTLIAVTKSNGFWALQNTSFSGTVTGSAGSNTYGILVAITPYMRTPILVNSAAGGSNGTITTSGIDTTGANLLVACVNRYTGGGAPAYTISDSKGNTWVALNGVTSSVSADTLQWWYCKNATVGTGHTVTFTTGGGSPFGAGVFAAFANGDTTSPLDQQATNSNQASSTTPIASSLTPTSANQMVLQVLSTDGSNYSSVNGGYSLVNKVDYIGGTKVSVAMVWTYQNAATATAPTITISPAGGAGIGSASFIPPGSTPAAANTGFFSFFGA